MAEEERMNWGDIITPDGTLDQLIKKLGEINGAYDTMVKVIQTGADKIAESLKRISGATSNGRQSIDAAALAATRLERAQRELSIATSATGKQIAWLNAQVSDHNKMSVETQRQLSQAVGSYDRLKSQLKESVDLYKSLTEAERADSNMGKALLADILNLKNQISAMDASMKPAIATLSQLEKAEQKLAYLNTEEGKRLMDVKAKIAELISERKKQRSVIDPLVAARERLANAKDRENVQLQLYAQLTQETNRIAKLTAQVNRSVEGSYNRLAAQYELNKIKLNAMSAEERSATEAGKKLEQETKAMYQEMIRLQEATGNHRLSVGHYEKAFDGLGLAISQTVRELPAAAISLNTFFLGISNNIPQVIDQIKKLREENKQLAEEGKPTVDITKQIVKSIFSLNTVMAVGALVFSEYGDEIVAFVINAFKAKAAILSLEEAIRNVNKEMEKNNGGYGQNIVLLKSLQQEWRMLRTDAQKNKFIKDNADAFDKLNATVKDVNDAESLLVKNTDAIKKAFAERAKAIAAQRLAAEQYEKALVKHAEMEAEVKKGPSREDRVSASAASGMSMATGPLGAVAAQHETAEKYFKIRIAGMKAEYEALMKAGDLYFELSEGYREEEKKRERKERGRDPRDLTDTINRNNITAQKKYEESITKLQNDEFAKRKKAAADQVQDENNRLREMYRKNVAYIKNVDGKYKELTEEQKAMIARQQDWITKTVANNLKILENQLARILNEQKINSERLQRETVSPTYRVASKVNDPVVTQSYSIEQNADEIEASLVRERKLMEENLELEYELTLETNKKLLEAGDEHARSEEEIKTELFKKLLEVRASYDKQILDLRTRNIDDQLELVKKGSEEELKLLLEKNELARLAAHAENIAKPAAEQVSSDTIDARFSKSARLTEGTFEMSQFDERQKTEAAEFDAATDNARNITKFKLTQEKERWEKQIALARSGGLDWSEEQIKAAEAAVKGVNAELKKVTGFTGAMGSIGKYGVGGSVLDAMGFSEEAISSFSAATDYVKGQLGEMINIQMQLKEAEIEAAEAAVEAAEKRIDAAHKALDAEIDARDKGYANDVEGARKKLQLEQQKQREEEKRLKQAQKEKEKLQKAQMALDTVTQISSLVTASAQLWSSFAAMGPLGPALATAAISTMWASFAASKVMAVQAASKVSASQEYGEGGLEFLEGGSHASGNDIDLHTKNRKGKNMRAEGGEALAIINKRNTRRYRKELPRIIEALNKGTFEDKYLKAFEDGASVQATLSLAQPQAIDLTRIENMLDEMGAANKNRIIVQPDGTILEIRDNVKRYIRR